MHTPTEGYLLWLLVPRPPLPVGHTALAWTSDVTPRGSQWITPDTSLSDCPFWGDSTLTLRAMMASTRTISPASCSCSDIWMAIVHARVVELHSRASLKSRVTGKSLAQRPMNPGMVWQEPVPIFDRIKTGDQSNTTLDASTDLRFIDWIGYNGYVGWLAIPRSHCSLTLHSKNSRVRFDPERVPFGQTRFWVRLIRNLGQTDTKSESYMSFWLGFRSVWSGFLVRSDLKMVWPNGTLSGSNLTREFLECFSIQKYYGHCNKVLSADVFGLPVHSDVWRSVLFIRYSTSNHRQCR